MSKKAKEGDGLFRSVLMAYAILLLHVLLAAALGVLVLFFRGIVQYMIWIFLFGSASILTAGYLFYRRMQKEGKTLREMLRTSPFDGRPVEVGFLGGLVTLRMGRSEHPPLLDLPSADSGRHLEHLPDSQVRELTELARLMENGLLSAEEYRQAKQRILDRP